MTPPALQLVLSVIGRKVEQRFGLPGLARLFKLVELVTARADGSCQRLSAVMAWGDLLRALQCDQAAAQDFLTYCDHARVVDRKNEGERVRLSLVGELATLLAVAESVAPAAVRTLFDSDEQWAEWFAADLNLPPHLRNEPETRRIFRLWCASNVTIDEVEAAAIRAANAREAPHPHVLHNHIKALRQEKIRAAN